MDAFCGFQRILYIVCGPAPVERDVKKRHACRSILLAHLFNQNCILCKSAAPCLDETVVDGRGQSACTEENLPGGGRKFSKSGPRGGVKHLGLEQLSEAENRTGRHDSGKVEKSQKGGLRQNELKLDLHGGL